MTDVPLTNMGRFEPSESRQSVLIKTVAGPGATAYPSFGDTVFYCQVLRDVSFTETPGSQTLTSTASTEYLYAFRKQNAHPAENSELMADFIDGYWYI